jgi:hypothetical protein
VWSGRLFESANERLGGRAKGVMGKRAKACDWRIGQTAKRRVAFVFSGEAEIQDGLGAVGFEAELNGSLLIDPKSVWPSRQAP